MAMVLGDFRREALSDGRGAGVCGEVALSPVQTGSGRVKECPFSRPSEGAVVSAQTQQNSPRLP